MNTNKINIRKLEADLWESADLLRAGSKLTSSQYCMPVLALLFLRYAYSRYKMVEQEIMANRPMRNGRAMPIEAADFQAKSALFLPKEAQFDYLLNSREMGNGVTDDTPRNKGERVTEKYLVKSGDLLFSWSATLMAMIWNGEDGWLNQHIFKVSPNRGICRKFLLQSIKNAIEEFANLTTGSTMKHIQ